MTSSIRNRRNSISGYPPFHGKFHKIGVIEVPATSDTVSIVEVHWFTVKTRPDSGYEFYVEHNGRLEIPVGDHVTVEFDHH